MNSTQITRSFIMFLLSLLTLTVSATPVGAQTAPTSTYAFTVDTSADTHDTHGDGKCADKKGRCSLRAAIEEADALPGGSSITITVPTGTYTLTLGTLHLTGMRTITINGMGSKTTIIKGNHTFGIMSISANVSAHLSQLTISGGKAYSGGGIVNGGTLTVSNSTLSNNSAYEGGGIWNNGATVTVSNSTISANSANQGGGGIWNFAGPLIVSNSTLSGNTANGPYGYGGGIWNTRAYYGGTVTVSNSTLSGNSATSSGGGIWNYGSSTVTLTGTIVANSPKGSNCSGTITEGVGYNVDSGTSCGFSLRSDLTNTDPMLDILRSNGGPTQTMALLQGSKAIDWVALSRCPATDQRGQPRPDGSGESTCDIGAYESSY